MRLRRIVLIATAAVVALVLVIVTRAARLASRQPVVQQVPALVIDTAAALARLTQALRLPTVSWDDTTRWRPEPFEALHLHLSTSYPAAHGALRREVVAGHSLLYEWPGIDPSLPPLLLLAHQDVVPPGGAPEEWTHQPFSGAVADGFIWGRGTIDDKGSLHAILEAVELLAREGFRPQRTLLLAFGHDEEVGGSGAVTIARLLAERGVRPALVLDEGGYLTTGVFPLDRPVAAVGVAEKGYVTLELIADVPGGHSSRPIGESAIGTLARALQRLERSPFPLRLQGVTRETLLHLAPELPFAQRAVLANLWLFRPLIERQLAASPTTAALLRTTMAPTIVQAGEKENVIPSRARAVINVRTLPGDSLPHVLRFVTKVIGDPRVTVRPAETFHSDPGPVSAAGSGAFALLRGTIRQVFPDAVVAPYLVIGATDARHYTAVSSYVYRFAPLRLHASDIERMHGIDERISVTDYVDAIRFYRTLIVASSESGALSAGEDESP